MKLNKRRVQWSISQRRNGVPSKDVAATIKISHGIHVDGTEHSQFNDRLEIHAIKPVLDRV